MIFPDFLADFNKRTIAVASLLGSTFETFNGYEATYRLVLRRMSPAQSLMVQYVPIEFMDPREPSEKQFIYFDYGSAVLQDVGGGRFSTKNTVLRRLKS